MEFWQPANHNIGAVSVVLDVVFKLRVIAHSWRAVLVFIHEQCVNKSKTSTLVDVCVLLVNLSSTTTVELQLVCSCISHPLSE